MKRRIANNKNIQIMEQKDIDIYEILKDMPDGTSLYTPMVGKVELTSVATNKEAGEAIWTENKDGEYSFNKNGRWMEGGEVLLFPSKEMRDWEKFSWKKGDVLVYIDGKCKVIFDKFDDYKYTSFIGKHYLESYGKDGELQDYEEIHCGSTVKYTKESEEAAQTYIKTIEKRLGGKLNLETLEIEKTQPEFKDGDIVALVVRKCTHIAIFQSRQEAYIGFHSVLCQNDELLLEEPFREDVGDIELRLATDSEKQQLFYALAKEGKRWDSEKKQIVDLKSAFEIGKLYVFNEDDEEGELTIIGKLIDKNESEDTLTFGNQYEIETEKFVTDQAFDLRISVNKELREATENEIELFNKHYSIWKKEKEAKEKPAFKTFDKVLVRDGRGFKWIPALFVRDRGEGANYRYEALSIQSGKTSGFSSCIPYEGHENFAFTDYDFVDLPF